MDHDRLSKLQRRWFSTSFPHFCRAAFTIWHARQEHPNEWIALVATATVGLKNIKPSRPRHSRKNAEGEAWLRRQLDGMGKGPAAPPAG